MSFIIIGIFVGFSFALTGSGGALLAIPLFMSFLGYSLKVGTFYSLIVVAIASIIGVLANLKDVRYRYAFFMALGSFVGSLIFRDIKQHLSDNIIIILFYIICLYSLYSIWKKNKVDQSKTLIEVKAWILLVAGLILGILTTLTGLGGGVLLLPLFVKGFQLEEQQAVATSLMTIFFSAGISFFLQLSTVVQTPLALEVLFIMIGVSLAVFPVKFFIKKIDQSKVFIIRRTVYSSIVVYTLVSLTLRG